MPVEALAAALIIGFTGSLHCVGMCGPLAMIVPLRGNKWAAIFTYHFSRIFVYALLGFAFGALGAHVIILESGQRLTLILGIALLLFFVVPAIFPGWRFSSKVSTMAIGFYGKLSKPAMQSKTFLSVAVLGAINGLLPCGLVYVALAGAVSTGSGLAGALFMLAVGLGTFPATITIMSLRNYINPHIQRFSRFAVPVVAGVLAFTLIARGLNLDIPFVSPKVEKVSTAGAEICE